MNYPAPPAAYVRRYLLHGLEAAPLTLAALLHGATETEWDARPDADRFTLREALAHLADWEGVWLARMETIAREDEPFLPSFDEGQWAIDHDYAHTNPGEQLAKFTDGRARLAAFLHDLPGEAWLRVGVRDEVGAVSLFEMVAMILGHDGYHARQIIEYRKLPGAVVAQNGGVS